MLHAKITRRNLIKSALMLLSANILLPSFQKSEAAEAKTDFYISKIDSQMFSRIKGKSYKDDCTLPLDDLRYLHLLHKDLHGKTREGELICNVYIAAPLLDIFMKLHEANYAIEKIRLIDEYDADDETSMRDNNSSCFNFRFISHTNKISKHGLGLAIDINPLYNPYIKIVDGKRTLDLATIGIAKAPIHGFAP